MRRRSSTGSVNGRRPAPIMASERQSSPNMKSFMNHGYLITGPAFDEGREQKCALYLAVLMRNWLYVIRRIYSLKIAGSR
jgi:hypothetical protein